MMKNHKRGKGKTEVVRGHVSNEQWQRGGRPGWWGQQRPQQSLRGPLMPVAEGEDEERGEDQHREWWPDGAYEGGYEDGAWAYDWQSGGYVWVPHAWAMQERWRETREVGTSTADAGAPSPQGPKPSPYYGGKGKKGKG